MTAATELHPDPHPMAGKAVVVFPKSLATQRPAPVVFMVEDYWDRVSGRSWKSATGNPVALTYGLRAGFAELPLDDEVLYGSVGETALLVHVTELMTEDQLRARRAEVVAAAHGHRANRVEL